MGEGPAAAVARKNNRLFHGSLFVCYLITVAHIVYVTRTRTPAHYTRRGTMAISHTIFDIIKVHK